MEGHEYKTKRRAYTNWPDPPDVYCCSFEQIEARVFKGGDVFKVKVGENISFYKEVDRIASEVERNSDAAMWLLNARAKLAMTKALALNDGFAKEDMKFAATNFCALPNIVNRIEAIRREGGPKKLFGEVTRLSILGSVKYKSCELEGDDQKDMNEKFEQILGSLHKEIEENRPTMSKKGEFVCRTVIVVIDLQTAFHDPIGILS